VLPEFLLPHRHYLVQVIHWVLEARFERQLSWEELKAECGKMELPTLNTTPLVHPKGCAALVQIVWGNSLQMAWCRARDSGQARQYIQLVGPTRGSAESTDNGRGFAGGQ